jgi:hypothetical protein
MKFEDIKDTANIDWINISGELYRIYEFKDKNVTVNDPIALNVSKGGGHRVINADGESFYIPSGWYCIRWKAREGVPHFVK